MYIHFVVIRLRYCHILVGMGDGKHQVIDLRNIEFGRIIAEKLREQPEMLNFAKGNIKRWIAQSNGPPPSAHLEWKDILEKMDILEIIELLTQDSENANRLRQSNPFAGVLTPQERWNVLKSYDKRSA